MSKSTGFSFSASKTGLTITNKANGAVLAFTVDKSGLTVDKSGLPAGKEAQYGGYLAKFIKDVATVHTSKSVGWQKRFEKVLKPVADKLDSMSGFRQLSNSVRRTAGVGLVDPKTGNFYYYEGAKWEYVNEDAATA